MMPMPPRRAYARYEADGVPVVAPPPPSFVSGLLQKIKGQYTQGENELATASQRYQRLL